MRYFLLAAVIALVTYGQLIIKYRIDVIGSTLAAGGVAAYLRRALSDPGILSGLLAAVIAALMWLLVLRRFDLSAAYPFLALNFLLVPLLAIPLLGESMNVLKGAGLMLVVAGLVVFAWGL